jgi:hypothetical protein
MVWVYVLLAVIVIAAGLGYVKKKAIELEADFQGRFAGKNIRFMDKHALYIAQQSDGYSHVRGMGYLVLTDEELYYKRQFGNKVLSIPLSSILHVGQTRRLVAQSTGRSMLKVAFTTLAGQEDAVAWRVKELQRWIDEISAAIGNK